jgi:hypothetical protein
MNPMRLNASGILDMLSTISRMSCAFFTGSFPASAASNEVLKRMKSFLFSCKKAEKPTGPSRLQ